MIIIKIKRRIEKKFNPKIVRNVQNKTGEKNTRSKQSYEDDEEGENQLCLTSNS